MIEIIGSNPLVSLMARHASAFISRFARKNTRDSYRLALYRYLLWVDGRNDLDPFAVPHEACDSYVEVLSHSLKRSTVKTRLAAIRRFYNHLERNGLVEVNHWHVKDGPPLEGTVNHAKPLSASELAELYEQAPTSRDLLIVRLMYEAGLRRQDVAALPTEALSRSVMGVYSLHVEGWRSKTGPFDIEDDLANAILEQISSNPPECPWIFHGYSGNHISVRHVNTIITKIAPNLRPHQLRITHMNDAMQDGKRLQDIA